MTFNIRQLTVSVVIHVPIHAADTADHDNWR